MNKHSYVLKITKEVFTVNKPVYMDNNATTKVERGAVTIFTAVEKSFINYAYKDLFIKVSNSVDRALMTGFDRWSTMANSFGDYDVA